MARLSRYTLFWRTFLVVLLVGTPVQEATADDATDWAAAVRADTRDAYIRYLRLNPAGSYIEQAIGALSRLGALPGAPATRGVRLY